MKLYLLRTEPIQEIAAEPETLEQFKTALSPYTKPALATPEVLGLGGAANLGFPLIADPELPPGEVHMRPTPGAPPPASPDELAAMLAVFVHIRPIRQTAHLDAPQEH